MAIVETPANWQHTHVHAPHHGAPPGNTPGWTGYPERPHRHPWEIGLLVLVILSSVVLYLFAFATVLSGGHSLLWLSILATPVVLYLLRGLTYGRQRANGVRLSSGLCPEYVLIFAKNCL